jgi:hypothetical protein
MSRRADELDRRKEELHMTAYMPEGRTIEARMQEVLRRREKWLIEHPEASSCVILVHANAMHTFGFWLKAHGATVAMLPRGGPAPDCVFFADGNDVEVSA